VRSTLVVLTAAGLAIGAAAPRPLAQAQAGTVLVRAIRPPATPLPPEAESANVTKFSFFAYGDTRGAADGQAVQPEHGAVVTEMLKAIPTEKQAGFPVRFVIQSGDAVVNGRDGRQWNVSYIPVVERLTQEAGLPYFFAVGNHDMGTRPVGDPDREARRKSVEDSNALLWPTDPSRKLAGYPAFSFGFGQTFFIAFDSNIPDDPVQLKWVSDQLERLDRARFPIVVVFFHHPPLTTGPHGGPAVERESASVRKNYMPLFRKHHVRMTITGHDHLYDHYIEHYDDSTGTHRMDQIVAGGGGAPIYTYRGEQDLDAYAAAAAPQRVSVMHAARPSTVEAENPHHFLIFEVDGDRIWEKWVATSAAPFMPFGKPRIELTD